MRRQPAGENHDLATSTQAGKFLLQLLTQTGDRHIGHLDTGNDIFDAPEWR